MKWARHARVLTLVLAIIFDGTAQAESGRRILLVGDSIMKAIARSLEREMADKEGVVVYSSVSISSGLARLDLFDWHTQIKTLVEEFKPDTVVIMMGANDNQPMKTLRNIVRFGTPEWAAEYGERVGKAMDLMIAGGVQRIFWLELPDMRDGRLQADVQVVNQIVAEQVRVRPAACYLEIRPWLSRTPGKFSPYIIQASGMPLEIRARDGIHLNRTGADFLAAKLVPLLLARQESE